MTTATNRDSAVNQRILSRLVEREVLHCISSTVDHFVRHPDSCVGGVDYDNILSLCSGEFNVDGILEEHEALEHWAVTNWFSAKLAAHGQIVGELLDFDVWGRCCSGQSISQDCVIAEIASEMGILDGQEYSWAE